MSFTDSQYYLNGGNSGMLPDIPVTPFDNADGGEWLYASKKREQEDREKRADFNYYNYFFKSKLRELNSPNRDIFIQIVDIFSRECQLPSLPGFEIGLTKRDQYNAIELLQIGYKQIMLRVIDPNTTEDQRFEALDLLQDKYNRILNVKNYKPSVVGGFKAAFNWITGGGMPSSGELNKNEKVYNLSERLSITTPIGEITYSQDELPGIKDYIHSAMGTGIIEDIFNYIGSKFYVQQKL